MSRYVDSTAKPAFRRRIGDVGQDRDVFSDTASRSHAFNSLSMGRPMRGGIRL